MRSSEGDVQWGWNCGLIWYFYDRADVVVDVVWERMGD
jgi:hypothetical protein